MENERRQQYFLGVDIGSSSSKGVVINGERKIVSQKIIRTKPKHREGLDIILEFNRKMLEKDILYCVGTGYGRNNIYMADNTVTEISCHAKGVYYHYPEARTVIDIGGQDSKVISLDENGEVIDFTMNEKCAAGTGRFLELVSRIFKIPLEDFGKISLGNHSKCKISSTCVVFAESEIVSRLAEGVRFESILNGVHASIVSRIIGMGRRIGLKPPIAFTGGMAENVGVIREIADQLNIGLDDIWVPENPKSIGALGAALYAVEEFALKSSTKERNKMPAYEK